LRTGIKSNQSPIANIIYRKKGKTDLATILERTVKVTAEKLGVSQDKVTPEASFTEQLGADSLDQVELIMGLEEEFGTAEHPIKIPDEDAAKIKTVQDAVNYLKAAEISDESASEQPARSEASKTPAAAKAAASAKASRKPAARVGTKAKAGPKED